MDTPATVEHNGSSSSGNTRPPDERPAKRPRIQSLSASPSKSPSGPNRRIKPGPSRSSVGLNLSRVTSASDPEAGSAPGSTTPASRSFPLSIDPIQATLALSKIIGSESTGAVGSPSSPSTHQPSYAGLLNQRDVLLRGFKAVQELRARENGGSPTGSQVDLETVLVEHQQALSELSELHSKQHQLEDQITCAQDSIDLLREEAVDARSALKEAESARDDLRRQRDGLTKELGNVRKELSVVRGELDAARAGSQSAHVGQHTSPEASLAADAEPSSTAVSMSPLPDDPLMAELDASLDALRHDTEHRERTLDSYMSELETTNNDLEAEREMWRLKATGLEDEVRKRVEEVAEWQRRYEARGTRLAALIHDMNELRARVV
ncbi:unnamed protein product [Peniophora sp. CBMAI 1063]|nr:unnamed protein product [Peniophora sp. CBMAI 1063]